MGGVRQNQKDPCLTHNRALPISTCFPLSSVPPASTVTTLQLSGMVPWIREPSSYGSTRFQLDQNVESHCSALLQCHHLAFGERWAYDRGRGLAFVMQHHTLASHCWTLKFGPPPLASRLSASGIPADAPCAAPRLLCRCHLPSIGPPSFLECPCSAA